MSTESHEAHLIGSGIANLAAAAYLIKGKHSVIP